MYRRFTYIWVIYGVNVGKYSIHGAHGIGKVRDIGYYRWFVPPVGQKNHRNSGVNLIISHPKNTQILALNFERFEGQ